MTTRLFVLIPATILLAMISFTWMTHGAGFPWFFGLGTIAGIYAIIRVMANHFEYRLTGSVLVIESPLKNTRTVDLRTLSHWQEFEFHIRGQRRRTIVVLFEKEKKVVLDNSDYESEFNGLLAYLAQHHAMQKVEPILKKPLLPF